MQANSLAVAVMAATAAILLYAGSITAPVHAWMVGNFHPFWLWGASFVHIDLSHLLANLVGLVLIQLVFGNMVSVSGWLFGLLVAAPAAHAMVVSAGHFAWVAGLSTALHAVVGFAALSLLLDETDLKSPASSTGLFRRWRRGAVFSLLVCAGLAVKVVIDLIWVTHWPQAQASTGASLHGVAAAMGGLCALFSFGPKRWARPIRFRLT
ncbi:MAG: hypothetical protein ACRBC3_16835 [Burkholderiaceae bacterium]